MKFDPPGIVLAGAWSEGGVGEVDSRDRPYMAKPGGPVGGGDVGGSNISRPFVGEELVPVASKPTVDPRGRPIGAGRTMAFDVGGRIGSPPRNKLPP